MNTPNSSAIKCTQVSKTYVLQKDIRARDVMLHGTVKGMGIKALRDISLDVPRGKIVGIVGKNGAGKSTLLRVLGGVYAPSSGTVEISGQVAGLFELGGMGSPSLTGRDYVLRYLSIMSDGREDTEGLLADVLDFSELADAFENPIRTYSSGMRARLYFSTATALQHEIYLIDELLSVGDEHFQVKCWHRMRQRLLNGASGVLVTHDWTAILRLCERAHVIERGRFIFSGTSDVAVVSYLNLPKAPATVARFTVANAPVHLAQSGADTTLDFFVEIVEAAAVDFALSVETLRIGLGWEIVLLLEALQVGDKPGVYKVCLSIPKLPLVPGSYSLNLFLSKRKLSASDPLVGLDSRTWTLGTGLSLEVTGELGPSAVKIPYTVRRQGAQE